LRDIKVATDDGTAYYDIVSRLKRTHLRFTSASVQEAAKQTDALVITSKKEAAMFGGEAAAVEDLDRDPLIMEGQLLSRLLERARRTMLVGVDPGSRIGVVVFYGGVELGAFTTSSVSECVRSLASIVRGVPHSALSVKIGAGEPKTSGMLANLLREELPSGSLIEIVDESGTSARTRGVAGATRDQRAAARIAFRKGVPFQVAREAKKNS